MSTSLYIGAFGMQQISYDMVESSDATGSEAIRTFGPPRWKASLAGGTDMTLAQASMWEALVLQLKRGINCLAIWDPVRPLPQGTMRGTPTLLGAASAGSQTFTLTGSTGTLNVGDWMQVGAGVGTSQLVKLVLSTANTGNGAGALCTFEPALRIPYAAGTAVTLQYPVFYGRNVNKSVRWDYSAGNMLVNGYALDLMETFQ